MNNLYEFGIDKFCVIQSLFKIRNMYRELLLFGYLKFYELYLLLINDYKYFVVLFMYSK